MTAAPTVAAAGATRRVDAIVIGGSAGAVEAMLALLPALPPRLQAAVFVVIHLPRDTPSLLTEIFSPVCPLPVVEAVDKLPVAPGTVYVAPADYHVLIDVGPSIALSIDPPVHWSRPSIDVLFESACEHYAERLLGIVLTGWNRDGARGLARIQRAGGVTVVQQPGTAQATAMPQAALAEVAADHVLPLPGIAGLLRSLGADARLPPPPGASATGEPARPDAA